MDVSYRAAVSGFRTNVADGKTYFTLRVVALNFGSGEAARQWTVEKRFSEFHALHGRLKKVASAYLPKVPPKKMFGAKKDNFLRSRQARLDEYVRALLRCAASREPGVAGQLRDFLGCDDPRTHVHYGTANERDAPNSAGAVSYTHLTLPTIYSV